MAGSTVSEGMQSNSPFILRTIFRPSSHLSVWLPPLLVAVALVVVRQHNELLFHALAELFTVTVAVLSAVVAWQTYDLSRDDFVYYLAIGYLAVALAFDLPHTLSFPGMGVFSEPMGNASAQLWVVGRYAEALVLLSAPVFIQRPLNRWVMFAAFALAVVVLFSAVFAGWLPDALVDSMPTAFRKGSSVGVSLLLIVALAALLAKQAFVTPMLSALMVGSILLTLFGELLFGIAAGQPPNVLGHLFKMTSYWLIFQAVLRSALIEPLHTLRRDARSFDVIPDPTVFLDTSGRILQTNQAARRLISRGGHDCAGADCHALLHGQEIARKDCPVCRFIDADREVESLEVGFTPNRWFQVTLSRVVFGDGKRGFVHVSREVTERRRLEEQLERYRNDLERLVEERTVELRAANQELEAFGYSMSHDLRTPLRAINGFSRILREDHGEQLSPDARDYLERVIRASHRMSQSIDGLLQLMDVIRRELRFEPLQLSEIAREVWGELDTQRKDRTIRLLLSEPLVTRGDRALVRLMLTNLFDNALKFTQGREEAVIGFGKTLVDGEETFYIKDNGVGFDMQYSSKLFQPFQRLHVPSEYEGNGIGLAIVRRIVQRHGGRVWAEGRMNSGASVFFTFRTRSQVRRA